MFALGEKAKRIIGIILVMSMLLTSLGTLGGNTITTEHSDSNISARILEKPHLEAYSTDSGINVTGNTELEVVANCGTGTETDPFIIAGVNITSDETAIAIYNTTSYLVIRHCFLDSVTYNPSRPSYDTVSHGLLLQNVTNCIIEDCIVKSRGIGIRVWESNNCAINRNTIFNNSWWSIYIGFSEAIDVSNNLIHNNYDTVRFLQCMDCSIVENTIHDNNPIANAGISLWSTNSTLVQENEITRQWQGIEFYITVHIIISDNTIHNCTIGIALYFINDSIIEGNTAYGNTRWGIYSGSESHRNTIFANILFDNGLNATSLDWGDGFDCSSTHSNEWDDGSLGNYWGEFNGTGVMDVRHSIDRFPMGIHPVISSPEDIEFFIGTTGRNITWRASALEPERLEIRSSGTLLLSSGWDSSTIYLSLDMFTEGIHDLELIVFDIHGDNATDSVLVTIHPVVITNSTTTPAGSMETLTVLVGILSVIAAAVLIVLLIRKQKVGGQ